MAQVLGRSASTIADDAAVLRALGMSRDHIGLASGLSHLIPAVVAAPVALGAALLASSHFPVGLGRRIDPDVGYHLDWTIVGPGMALVVVLVLAASVLVGRGSPAGRRPRDGSSKSGAWRRSAPVAIGLGTTMAFETGRGPRHVPVLPALLAATVAVMGVVASLTIDRGINYALQHPELAGVTWDASVTPALGAQTGRNISPKLAREVTEAPGIRAAAVVDRDVINVGNVGAPVFSVRPVARASATSITFASDLRARPARAGRSGYRPRDRQGPSRRYR